MFDTLFSCVYTCFVKSELTLKIEAAIILRREKAAEKKKAKVKPRTKAAPEAVRAEARVRMRKGRAKALAEALEAAVDVVLRSYPMINKSIRHHYQADDVWSVAEGLYRSSRFLPWSEGRGEAFDAAAAVLGRSARTPARGVAAILRKHPELSVEEAEEREATLRAFRHSAVLRGRDKEIAGLRTRLLAESKIARRNKRLAARR
jgi:hypothetical protein